MAVTQIDRLYKIFLQLNFFQYGMACKMLNIYFNIPEWQLKTHLILDKPIDELLYESYNLCKSSDSTGGALGLQVKVCEVH